MLDTLSPTDPVLLLGVVEGVNGAFNALPRDVRSWFGFTPSNRVEITPPTSTQRSSFFESLLDDVKRPPNKFAPSGHEGRRKRVLEQLPLGPPVEPRKPTEKEMAALEESDRKTMMVLKYRLGPIVGELKRKFKRFGKSALVGVAL